MLKKYLDNAACDKAIKGICKGERNALSIIYQIMHRQIYSIAIAICKNNYDAEDVLQDTLCEIVKCASQYKSGNARAWIMGIARNLSLRKISGKHFHVNIDEIESSANLSSSKDALAESYILLDAMSRLEKAECEIVVMKVLSGLTYKEIASISGQSVDSVKRTYYKALKKLKAYFDVAEE